MKYLFQAATVAETAEIAVLKDILEESKIPCTIRNENLAVAMGEIPCTECFPELWVLQDTDYARAEKIVTGWRRPNLEPENAWVCPNCHEAIERQFTSCWKCGNAKA